MSALTQDELVEALERATRRIDALEAENEEARRLLANATDPENRGDWDEARDVGWAWVRLRDAVAA